MRPLTLTSEHVSRVHRAVGDPGAPPGQEICTDEDYENLVERIVSTHPAPRQPIRLFAFGSLIWKPEIEHLGEEVGVARGWHRAFCMRETRFRGTPEEPGLMMALDHGGQCRGVLFELPKDDLRRQIDKLLRREVIYKPSGNKPRWIRVETEAGGAPALAFVMNRASPRYARRLPLETVADVLARACGLWGSGAEYLFNTVRQLEARGIHDGMLWRLQRLVAESIERNAL